MSEPETPIVNALACNVAIPESLQWTDVRRGETYRLTTLTIRRLPDGDLAAKAYGRPLAGGRGTYVSFPVPDEPALSALIQQPARYAAALWADSRSSTGRP